MNQAALDDNTLLQYAAQALQKGMLQHAEAACRKILAANPGHPDALHILGIVAGQAGQYAAAIELITKSLTINPVNEGARTNLLKIYQEQTALLVSNKQYDEAVVMLRKAVALFPGDPHFALELAEAYKKTNNPDPSEVEKIYGQAIIANPNVWELHFNMAALYWEQGLFDDAVSEYEKALALNPGSLQILLYLGSAYVEQSNFSKAYECLNKALSLDPDSAQAHLALGKLESAQGNIKKALEHYKRSYLAHEDYMAAYSNYLFTMHYDPDVKPEDIYNESLAWAARYTDAIPHMEHNNERDPGRRLRIGYVSADLSNHPVTAYLEPVLKSHDKSQVEVFCYVNQTKSDDATQRCKSYVDHWRNIYRVSDDALAKLIQQDRIDILIDLSGHTAGNRLLVFARKPAPIQATWIGYFNTTGMKAMDYIITDRFLLPPDEEHLYTEKPLRLPSSGAVYLPHDLPINVNALPALKNGYVTFGCFNALSKLTPEVLGLWAEVLKRVPDAKLFLKNKSFGDESVCNQFRAKFKDLGVNPERLLFAGQSNLGSYLMTYNEVDLGLDPFPYNGATTTFDSIWMGVPVIALKGDRLVSHIGESLLGAVGLEECIAKNKEEYVEKAVALANDIGKLSGIRGNLRQTLTSSPMTNPAAFTAGLEEAYRKTWTEWCNRKA